MKLLLILFATGALAAPPRMEPVEEYHRMVGIPLAERIKQQEMAMDFDGARIVGGSPIGAGVHQFVVGLLTNFVNAASICTATMLSNTRTLTAAHCSGAAARSYTLVFGSTYLFSGGVRVETTEFISHPLYGTFNYDIAIIRHSWVAYTNLIQPITLPTGFADYAHQWAMAVGYGQTNTNLGIPSTQTQHQIWLWVMSNDECRQFAGSFLIPAMICTSGAGGIGVCNGDSGGPLFIVSGNNRIQIGVTSFRGSTCEAGEPSGYIRVTYFQNWIRENL